MRHRLDHAPVPRQERTRDLEIEGRRVRWGGAHRPRAPGPDREIASYLVPTRADWPGTSVAEPASLLARGLLCENIILLSRVDGPRLPVTSVVGLARQFRRALMTYADQPVAEVISGHQSDGTATETPHLMVVPLPAVTGPRSDGTLIGIALVLPRGLRDDARGEVMRAIARFENAYRSSRDALPSLAIRLGDSGALRLRRVANADGASQVPPWIGTAQRWISATPIALDRNPGDLGHADPALRLRAHRAAASCVTEAVRRQGLPPPVEVDVFRYRSLPGVAAPQRYPRFPPSTRRLQRVLVHAHVRFEEPVTGPILVGAGRFHGLGLLLPVTETTGLASPDPRPGHDPQRNRVAASGGQTGWARASGRR